VLSPIYAFYNSLWHALSLLSSLCLHWLLPGNGSQQCRFLNFRVHVLTAGECLTTTSDSDWSVSSVYSLGADPTENRPPTVLLLLCSCIRCSRSMITELFPRNDRLFWLHNSGFEQIHISQYICLCMNGHSSVSVKTGYGLDASVRFPAGARFFSTPQRRDRLWGPPSLL
jgi:hypothetical protein